jgi:hypothetical protein
MKIVNRRLTRLFALLSLSMVLLGTQAAAQAQTTTVPRVAGFGALVSINQPEYWTDFMPPGVRIPEITATLTVFNQSKLPVTFSFPSSQRYDFAIANSDGVEVWRWSNGRFFLQVLGSLTLNPGQSVTFTEKIRFADRSGHPFPQGLYTLTGGLTSREPQSWNKWAAEGSIGFKHYYVY